METLGSPKDPDELVQLELDTIVENPVNPRQTFGDLEGLADDIKKRGVLEPIMVRLSDHREVGEQRYELIFGARRLRACQLAGLDTIPAIVREMTYVEALETMMVENEQREDVHPLERGKGYRSLLEVEGYTVPMVAEKIGQSEAYVYQHLKLAELIPAVVKAFYDNLITLNHAEKIARLLPEEQKLVFERGLFRQGPGGADDLEAKSTRELAEWIKGNIGLDPKQRRQILEERRREANKPAPPPPPAAVHSIPAGELGVVSRDVDEYVSVLVPGRWVHVVHALLAALGTRAHAYPPPSAPPPLPPTRPASAMPDDGFRCEACGKGPHEREALIDWSEDYRRVGRYVCATNDCRAAQYGTDSAKCAGAGIVYVGPESCRPGVVLTPAPPRDPNAPDLSGVRISHTGQITNEITER